MNISEIYHNALLAQAAYADDLNDTKDNTNLLISRLESVEDMTISQAQYIANNFRVVAQQDKTASGFSATLFQRLDENGQPIDEYYFAARGSDDGVVHRD
ncbi:unnamed protein product, partial [Discosporangium mesarthrocarpum]